MSQIIGKKKLKLAERMGYVPSYIFAKLVEEKLKLVSKGIDVIDLSLGSPNLLTPKVVVDECIKAVKDPENYKYPPFGGQVKFRIAACEWLKKRFSIDIDPIKEILPLSGAKEGIAHIALAMINPGDITIVPSPYYPVHARGTLLAGGKIYEAPLLPENDYLIDLETIPQNILEKAKMFFLSYPNNPTGAVCDLEYMEKVVHFCKKHEILLVSDLAYSELTFDGFVAPSIFEIKGAKDIAIEFHTMSKTYSMAGWRIAFVIGNEDIIKASYEIKTNTDYGVCNITQSASISAFSIPLEEHKKTAMIYQERRNIVLEKIKKLGWNIPAPKGAMYIWLPIPKNYKCSFDFSSDILQKAHVATIPGGSFGTYGEKYIRLALVQDKELLSESIDRIEKAGMGYN